MIITYNDTIDNNYKHNIIILILYTMIIQLSYISTIYITIQLLITYSNDDSIRNDSNCNSISNASSVSSDTE